ncbi:MAG: hypothetical protein GX275_11185 [Clostridiales bacterium]|nr:hypothetical protein [Clostridiales bacterium]
MKNKKRGISLLEILVYLFLSIIIISISTSIFIKIQETYYNSLLENKKLNSIVESFISIENMAKSEEVIKIECINNNVKIYCQNVDEIMVKELKLKDTSLIVNHYIYISGSYYTYGSPNTILLNVNDFSAVKKGNLIYLNLKINNEDYTKCI